MELLQQGEGQVEDRRRRIKELLIKGKVLASLMKKDSGGGKERSVGTCSQTRMLGFAWNALTH